MTIGELEAELRAILVPYEDELETGEIYGVEVLRRPGARKHEWFAGVRPGTGDGSIKFMLLPMHTYPGLLVGLSPTLRKRKTGASLFTLRAGDDALLPELEQLVARSFEVYMSNTEAEAG